MAMVPGKAPTPPTVTLKHLAAALAEQHEMSKKQAETVLGDLVGNIVKHLKKGERIRIGGLGILQVRKRAARIGRNPATGEQIQIKASKRVAFHAAKELKMRSDQAHAGRGIVLISRRNLGQCGWPRIAPCGDGELTLMDADVF